MSTNGAPSTHKSLGSSSVPPSTDILQANQPLSDARKESLDSDRGTNTSSPIHSNGVNGRASPDSDSESDPIAQLQRELERTKEEKEALAGQYRNLLAKLTTMRTTLGNKLQQDAVRTFGFLYAFWYCC